MLRCDECGRLSEGPDDARDWRAYLADDHDGADSVVPSCRECAEREFGGDENRGPQ